MPSLTPDSAQTCALIDRADAGDCHALGELLQRSRDGLHRFVDHHLAPWLRPRLDPSDVVQDVQMELARRFDDFLCRRPMPFHLWVRKTAHERLLNLQRDHRRARRSPAREVPLPEQSSLLIAQPLLSRSPSPSRQAEAAERAEEVSRAVAELADADREVLLLRHAEQLCHDEIACLLGLEPAAARKRYGRALIRLQKVLAEHGLLEEQP
jgi:RNA polymerase sigma-70 factor (ECF subfamily)